MPDFLKPSLNWLLVFVPVAAALRYLWPGHETWVFITAALAIIPLAGLLGTATEHLARQTSQGIGGLLNATFGNAAELIIALIALAGGLRDVVKASLTGAIIGNLLLVLGASLLAGGVRYREQRFNPTAARVRATMLTLAAIALILPAAYDLVAGPEGRRREGDLSLEIAAVLFFTYALELLFSLRTHKDYFSAQTASEAETHEEGWSKRKSILVLALTTAMVGWVSEMLVGSVEVAGEALGMTSLFVGVIIVGIVGNAAEHSTAVLVARKNQMDLSVGIAIGSSTQIALFVAPVLVFVSYFIGPQPMDLVFTPAEVLAIVVAIWITGQIAGDGESNWLEGVQLIAVYLILAIVFYFLPASSTGMQSGH
jgi:Ca2+:H+ antiporter